MKSCASGCTPHAGSGCVLGCQELAAPVCRALCTAQCAQQAAALHLTVGSTLSCCQLYKLLSSQASFCTHEHGVFYIAQTTQAGHACLSSCQSLCSHASTCQIPIRLIIMTHLSLTDFVTFGSVATSSGPSLWPALPRHRPAMDSA